MPLFVCDVCHAIDNTAVGHYWSVDVNPDVFGVPELVGKRLCAENTPAVFKDGSPNPRGGKWHGKFPKRIATKELIDQMGREHFVYTAGL